MPTARFSTPHRPGRLKTTGGFNNLIFYEIAELSISSVEARGGGQHYEPFF
jgi:hypothetical protein